MAKDALKIWMKVPADIRNKILNNVFCPQCRGVVRICDFSVELVSQDIVLNGFCSTCGHKVARVIEGIGIISKTAVKKGKSRCALQNYIFDVWLYGDEECREDNRIIRKIQIAGTKSLYNFARVITQAFEFQFDHCFGFYDTLKNRADCKKAFELFVDAGEDPTRSIAKGVKKVKISQAFKHVGEELIFLFDYGDGWQFHVELKEIRNARKWDLKPVILETTGKAPLQYPPSWEEEGEA